MAGKTRDSATWFTVLDLHGGVRFVDLVPTEGTVTLTARDEREWAITITYAFDATGADAVALSVAPVGDVPPGGIKRTRDLHLGEAIMAGRHALAEEARAWGLAVTPKPREAGRRRALDESWFLDLAARAYALRGVKAPIPQLAKEFGYSEPHIRRLLGRCDKEFGFLGPAQDGQFERDLTDKARDRLAQREES